MTTMTEETTEQPTSAFDPEAPEADFGPGARVSRLFVAVLILLGLGLRLWGSSTGMPYTYLLDESAYYVPQAVRMFDQGLNPGWFVNPPAFTYVLHAAFAVFSAGGRGMSEQFLRNPEPVWLLARAMSAAIGAAAIGLIYVAGSRFFNRLAGLFAAALLAVAFLPVFYGHFALNDSPLLFPICLSLAGIAEAFRSGSRRGYAVAAVGLGLAAATKYSAGMVGLALLLVLISRRREDGFRPLLLVAGVSALTFVVVNPYSLLDAGAFFGGLAHQSEASSGSGGKAGQVGDGGIFYYLGVITWGVGWVPLLAAFGGAGVLAARDRALGLVLCLPPVAFLLFMGTYSRWFGRWAMPTVPFVCLLAGFAGAVLVAQIASRRGSRVAVPVALLTVAALCVQGLLLDVHLGNVLSRTDTRAIARSWMRTHIPRGAQIVVEPGVVPQRWLGESIDFSRPFSLSDVRWQRHKTWKILSQRQVIEGSPEVYTSKLKPELVLAYRNKGWCWVMTSSTQRGRAEVDRKRLRAANRYYSALKRSSSLAFVTSPWPKRSDPVPFDYDTSFNFSDSSYVRPGPEIKIYHLHGGRCS